MPEIDFILPHWIYWGGIFLVPTVLFIAHRRGERRARASGVSLGLAYFFLLVAGFMGIHRLYLKSFWAVVFIALFVGVISCNNEARLARNDHSIARNDVANFEYDIQRAQEDGEPAELIAELTQGLEVAQARYAESAEELESWHSWSETLAAIIALLMLVDAVLLPYLVRRATAATMATAPPATATATNTSNAGGTEGHGGITAKPTVGRGKFSQAITAINWRVGEFVSYWTVIAVFVFYYEVIARYVFNSPTVWAHESMYLLFGMQYLLAGGFCLREDAHVRVDVIYMHLSPRGRAIANVVSSVFFFGFATALAVTGWIFFADSFAIREVSFTEWGIAHFPIKFALPLGGALILLQGVARLAHDIEVLRTTPTRGADEAGQG